MGIRLVFSLVLFSPDEANIYVPQKRIQGTSNTCVGGELFDVPLDPSLSPLLLAIL